MIISAETRVLALQYLYESLIIFLMRRLNSGYVAAALHMIQVHVEARLGGTPFVRNLCILTQRAEAFESASGP